MCVCSTNLGFSLIPGTYYVPDTYVPGISRQKSIRTYVMFRPWTHTSDDSYIYQLSLVVATATVSFERSEFLIATSPQKKCVCACSTNLGFSGEKNCARLCVCSTNLGFSVGYVLCTTYVRTSYQHVCTWYQPATLIRICCLLYTSPSPRDRG